MNKLILIILVTINCSFAKDKVIKVNTYKIDSRLIDQIKSNNLYSEFDALRLDSGLLEKEKDFVKKLNLSLLDIESGRIPQKKAKKIVELSIQYNNIKKYNKTELKNIRRRFKRLNK
tara:strand:+ start:902 stop:1252 length:351 start_codon:yes stop_codon:yes gene_type:complete